MIAISVSNPGKRKTRL